MASTRIIITMTDATIRALVQSGYQLSGFRGVATSDDRTMPAVWMLTNAFAEQIQIHCDDGLIGYTSHTPVSVGQQVAFIKSAPVAVGNELVIPDGSGLFDIRSGLDGAVSFLNSSGTQFTAGLASQNGSAAGVVCAAPLYGTDLKLVRTTDLVLLTIGGTFGPVSSIATLSYGPGVAVHVSADAPRALAYDIDKGWSWDGAWASAVAPGTPLAPLLTPHSTTLQSRALARRRVLAV